MKKSTETKAEKFEVKEKIEFKDVWLKSESDKSQWLLKNVNLTILKDEKVSFISEIQESREAIIGLLMRFIEPDAGQILIDGVDIKTIDLTQLRKAFGLINKFPHLFNCSVAENILLGNPQASNSKIVEVLEKVGLKGADLNED